MMLLLGGATWTGGCGAGTSQSRDSAVLEASNVQEVSVDSAEQGVPDTADVLTMQTIGDVAEMQPSLDCGQVCVPDLGSFAADLSTISDAAMVGSDLDAALGSGQDVTNVQQREASDRDALDVGLCASSAFALCDDSNECTIDRLDENCACVHDMVSDGMPCDDGDICTENDQCVYSICIGSAYESAPAILGIASSLSDSPGLGTRVAFPSENRVVFATSNRLTLVGLDADQLKILDRRESAILVKVGQISPQIWVLRPRYFLVPLGDNRLAVIGDLEGIDLYDLSGDAFASLGRYGFSAADHVYGATGRGDCIWICAGTSIQRYTIDGAGNLAQGQIFTLPTNHSCQALTLSSDGNTLLAATWNGLDFVDVSSSDGTMVLSGGALSGKFLLDVAANTQYVAVYEMKDQQSALGNVLVLPAGGDSPIATFLMESDGPTPVGFTMVDAGLILQRAYTGTWAPLIGELYGIAPTGASLLQSWIFRTIPPGVAVDVPFYIVGSGAHVALEPFHQIVRIANSSEFVPVTGPEQGSFERVRAAGNNSVEAHGSMSMALVDIANPASPVLKEGGMVLPPSEQVLQLELSSSGNPAPTVLTISTSAGSPSGATMSLLWSRQDELPTSAGSIVSDGASGSWIAAGNYLVQIVPEGFSDFRIRRFRASSISNIERQKLVPELEQVVSTSVPSEVDTRIATWLDMDAKTGRIAILEERRTQGADASSLNFTCLNVFFLQPDGYRWSFAEPSSTDRPIGVAVAKDLTLFATTRRVVLFGATGEVLASLDTDAGKPFTAERLLSFDGKIVYLVADGYVKVLRATDFSEIGSYTTPEAVTSIATVGKYLVFGMPDALSIASPICPSIDRNE
jgi:hypothetical protein